MELGRSVSKAKIKAGDGERRAVFFGHMKLETPVRNSPVGAQQTSGS